MQRLKIKARLRGGGNAALHGAHGGDGVKQYKECTSPCFLVLLFIIYL